MASTLKWSAGSWTSCFGASDLNSCANGTTVLSSLGAATIDNSSSLETGVQFEFTAGSMSPTNAADVVVALLPKNSSGTTVDGEATGTIANQPIWMNYPHAAIGLRTKASSTQNQLSDIIPCPPGQYTPMLLNRAGVALPASGNMVKARLVTQQIV